MSRIAITITGSGQTWRFSNDWDECEAKGWLHIEEFEGWYGGVGATLTPETKRFQSHGQFPAPTIRGARKMDITLTWHYCLEPKLGDYNRAARYASGIAADMGPYSMTVDYAGLKLTSTVQLDGEPAFANVQEGSEQAFRLRLPLRAVDPRLYGEEKTYTVLTRDAYQGLRYNIFGQGHRNASGSNVLTFGSSAPNAAPTITNAGNFAAHPIFTVRADSPDGVRINVGGKVVNYRGTLFDTVPLVIDMTGKAMIRGRDVSQNLTARNWSSIPPRGRITPTISFPEGGIGYADCTARDTYL